jgi:DNA-3-methyladenine glycosylase
MKKLPRNFYDRNTIDIAVDLLGCEIISTVGGVKSGGMIVETEAYRGPDDPACHAFVGQTRRNGVMFGPPGRLYVYFTYGNHYMLNVVCEPDGFPAAVLLRAVEPRYGIEIMRKRREIDELTNLCSGPGKLAKALGITISENNTDLLGSKIFIRGPSDGGFDIAASPRIGIGERGHRKLWRFHISGNAHVSKGGRYVRENSHTFRDARKIKFDLG